MSKYTEQFKLVVVKQYLRGVAGYGALAKRHGVLESALRGWVKRYQCHGRAGLKKKFSHYDAPFKLSVLQHMWKHELSYNETSAMFDIRAPGAVSAWERSYHSGGIDALIPRTRGRSTKMTTTPKPENVPEDDERSRAQLVREVERLRAEVAYLKKLEALVREKPQAPRKKRK